MTKDLKGSRTEQILINSFAGESQARNRYTFFAKVAKNEGYEQIASIFLATAENEYQHAKLFYNHIGKNMNAHVDSFYPYMLGTTEENLKFSIDGEEEEFNVLYYNGEMIAKEEGFEDVAETFKNIRVAEQHHAQRYRKLYENLINDLIFKKKEAAFWVCRKCGYVYESNEAPNVCPCCKHPRAYFELLNEKY